MKKYIKLLVLSTVIVLPLTACSSQDNSNNTKQKTTQNSTNQSSTTQTNNVEVKHNYDDARALVNDWISLQLNSFDFRSVDYARQMPSGFATLATTKNVEKIEIANSGAITVYNLSDIVDIYNTYNRNIYNEKEVLADIENLLSREGRTTFTKVVDNYKDKSVDEIKALAERMGTVLYFSGDKKIVANIPFGLGGANFPLASSEDKWQVKDDTLEIPMVTTDNEVKATITLKLNKKDYVGGNKKSTYYVYNIEEK